MESHDWTIATLILVFLAWWLFRQLQHDGPEPKQTNPSCTCLEDVFGRCALHPEYSRPVRATIITNGAGLPATQAKGGRGR